MNEGTREYAKETSKTEGMANEIVSQFLDNLSPEQQRECMELVHKKLVNHYENRIEDFNSQRKEVERMLNQFLGNIPEITKNPMM
jgi:ABC-type transporter MlaC component